MWSNDFVGFYNGDDSEYRREFYGYLGNLDFHEQFYIQFLLNHMGMQDIVEIGA